MASASYENVILENSGNGAADYSSYQYYGGYHSAENTITLNAAQGGWCEGPIQNQPESGDVCNLAVGGIALGYAGGVWAVGDPLCVNSSGQFIKALHRSDYVLARALEVAASGEVHTIMITNEGYGAAFGQLSADGRGDLHTIRATFDPSTNASERTIAAHDVAETLPDNAVLVNSAYLVVTTFTSATDAATISIGHDDDVAGIVAATAISAGGNIWDAGWHQGIQDIATITDASDACTAEQALVFTVAVEVLTAGKLIFFGQYVIID